MQEGIKFFEFVLEKKIGTKNAFNIVNMRDITKFRSMGGRIREEY